MRDNTTNGGLTLVGTGDGGNGGAGQRAAVAPGIPVPPPVPTPPPFNSDGAPTIYGVSGGFTADGPTAAAGGMPVPVERDPTCYNYAPPGKNTNAISCGSPPGAIRVSAVVGKLNASFVRFNVNLACNEPIAFSDSQGTSYATRINPAAPGPAWWGSDNANPLRFSSGPHKGEPVYTAKGKYYIFSVIPTFTDPRTGRRLRISYNEVAADTQDRGGLRGMLIALARYRNRLIPVIDVTANGYCSYHSGPPNENTPRLWYSQMRDLVKYLHDQRATLPMVYVEIGNEVDTGSKPRNSDYSDGRYWDSTDGTFHYEDVFAAAARGLNQALPQYGYRNYRIITAGMQGPTASLGKTHAQTPVPYCTGAPNQGQTSGVYVPQNNAFNVFAAGRSIRQAENGTMSYPLPPPFPGPASPAPPVAASRLGVAVHPYGYFTQNAGEWRNLYATGQRWGGPCLDLLTMVRTWTRNVPRTTLPSPPGQTPTHDSRYNGDQYDLRGLPLLFTETNESVSAPKPPVEGRYVADLFTWLYNYRCLTSYQMRSCGPGASLDPGNDLLRVAIFNGAGDPEGIYDKVGAPKIVGGLPACPGVNATFKPTATSVTIDRIYRYLLNKACYYYPAPRS